MKKTLSKKIRRYKSACKRKIKLSEEEAVNRIGQYPKSLEIYLCPHCGWLHFTHPTSTEFKDFLNNL